MKSEKALDNVSRVVYSDSENQISILKFDDEQRVAYGWATIISKAGEPVIDLQGDIISSEELLFATTDFMKSARMAKAMHTGGQVGEVIHSFPLTAEIAKSLGIETENEGWLVGVHVSDDVVWNLVKQGKYAAFSIGGAAIRTEV